MTRHQWMAALRLVAAIVFAMWAYASVSFAWRQYGDYNVGQAVAATIFDLGFLGLGYALVWRFTRG